MKNASRFLDKINLVSFVNVIDGLKELQDDDATRTYAEATSKRRYDAWKSKMRVSPRSAVGVELRSKDGVAPVSSKGFDHAMSWERGGRQVCVTFEPYKLDSETLGRLAKLETEHGFFVRITANSFYFPGRSVLVEIWGHGEKHGSWPLTDEQGDEP